MVPLFFFLSSKSGDSSTIASFSSFPTQTKERHGTVFLSILGHRAINAKSLHFYSPPSPHCWERYRRIPSFFVYQLVFGLFFFPLPARPQMKLISFFLAARSIDLFFPPEHSPSLTKSRSLPKRYEDNTLPYLDEGSSPLSLLFFFLRILWRLSPPRPRFLIFPPSVLYRFPPSSRLLWQEEGHLPPPPPPVPCEKKEENTTFFFPPRGRSSSFSLTEGWIAPFKGGWMLSPVY